MITAASGCGEFFIGLNRCTRGFNPPFGDFDLAFPFLLPAFGEM
jgi:hypothetical protein